MFIEACHAATGPQNILSEIQRVSTTRIGTLFYMKCELNCETSGVPLESGKDQRLLTVKYSILKENNAVVINIR